MRLTLLLLALPATLFGYAVPIHELMPLRALAREAALNENCPAVTQAEMDAFRTWLDAKFRAHPDAAVRARYVKRWPEPAKFTARAFKRLMSLNEDLPQNGFDRAEQLPCTALKALSLGSGQTDTDHRNRERLAYDAHGKQIKLSDGREVPADPGALNMGAVRGLSSQAHAHYGLTAEPLSADPAVLQEAPWRFAISAGWPGEPVRAFAREQCQLHYDLAVLAHAWGQAPGRSLGFLFLGHGMHFVEDVGNQIHTVQIGHYDLIKRGKVLYYKRALKTLGGYLDELKPWTRVALEQITTHHVISENLNAKRVKEAVAGKATPLIQGVLDGLGQDDPELVADFDRLPKAGDRPARAAAILGALVERSSREGADVYRHVALALHPRMAEYGVLVDTEDDDPDTFLGDTKDPVVAENLEALYKLHGRAYKRVGTALRRVYAAFAEDTKSGDRADAFAAALLKDRLDFVDSEEERLARYVANPPKAGALTVREPVWLAVPLAPVLLILVVWWRRRQGRARAG